MDHVGLYSVETHHKKFGKNKKTKYTLASTPSRPCHLVLRHRVSARPRLLHPWPSPPQPALAIAVTLGITWSIWTRIL
jgi:hypothetical protein